MKKYCLVVLVLVLFVAVLAACGSGAAGGDARCLWSGRWN